MALPDGSVRVPGRLRVLWVIKGLGPGGAERLLVSAAKVHDRSRFEFEAAYVLPWKKDLVPELEAEGIIVHCLGAGPRRNARWIANLRHLVATNRYDIVHAHLPLVAGTTRLVVRSLPRAVRPRMVSTEHNCWSNYTFATRALNGLTAGLDDASIAVSEETRASMWWSSVRRRTTVIVHGVDVEQLRAGYQQREAVREKLGIEAGETVVATIANFRPQKAYPDLLAAARMVLDRGLPVRFVAAGQGPLEAAVRSLHAQLGLDDRFLLLGFRRDVAELLAAADVFTLASTYEGYPVALMEALVMGLPIVATNVGGVREAVRHGVEGLLVPASRPDLLAEALAEVLSQPTRRRHMAAAAAARGATYDISLVARRIEAVYREVAQGTARPDRIPKCGG